MYNIRQDFIPGIPQLPYRGGVDAYEGVCLHATACWNDSDESEVAYEKRNWQSAFVHAFCDHDSITQCAPLEYLSWGCGKGNSRFVNIELCQSRDAEKFKEAYSRWIFMAAYVLHRKGLGVIDGQTLVSHKWVTENLGGTHTDPHEYLAFHGKTWANVVNDVQYLYTCMDNWANQAPNEDAEKAKAVIEKLGEAWFVSEDNEIRGRLHELAELVRQKYGIA